MQKHIYIVMAAVIVTFLLGLSAGNLIAADKMAEDPNVKVLLENDQVRVFEAKRSPGTKVPMHEHPKMVVYFLSSYKAKQILPNGKENVKDYKAGKVGWLPNGLKHSIEILGTVDQHVVVVEMKE